MSFWPFRKQQSSTAALLEPPDSKEQDESLEIYSLKESRERFFLTDKLIIERAELKQSSDPVFRDGFSYFANKLQANPHANLLKLIEFGEENGRLYRVWEKRAIRHAVFHEAFRAQGFAQQHLAGLVSGFRHLHSLGVKLGGCGAWPYASADESGYYLPKLPWSCEGCPDHPHCEPNWVFTAQLLSFPEIAHMEDAEDYATTHLPFQFQLGSTLWFYLTGGFAYRKPALAYLKQRLPVERGESDLPSTLKAVLYRLTDVEPVNRYPNLDQALGELEVALKASFQT